MPKTITTAIKFDRSTTTTRP